MNTKDKPAQRQLGGHEQDINARRVSVHAHYTPIQAAGKVIGHVCGGVFRKRVKATKHQLRYPPAWALDSRSLEDAERAGAHRVEIHDLDSGQTYTATISLIRQFGFVLDRGHGRQIALPLPLWACQSAGPQQLPLWTVA